MKRYLLVLLAACGSGVHDEPGGTIDWTGPGMSLQAGALTLVVDGVTFHGSSDQFELKTGMGDELDATWAEAGDMPRIHLDFSQGSGSWSVEDARAYRLDQTDWIEQTGPYYTTPAAQAYDGDLDFVIDQSGHHAEIHFTDARLAPLGIP